MHAAAARDSQTPVIESQRSTPFFAAIDINYSIPRQKYASTLPPPATWPRAEISSPSQAFQRGISNDESRSIFVIFLLSTFIPLPSTSEPFLPPQHPIYHEQISIQPRCTSEEYRWSLIQYVLLPLSGQWGLRIITANLTYSCFTFSKLRCKI